MSTTDEVEKTNDLLTEVRRYWEVPAIAHYCALFSTTFKLLNFDLEDFEEGLVADTENSRSPLIVDLLISVLQGCVGRKELNILNYNQCLYDLLEIFWFGAGLGLNPLGADREKACFHILPLYAKVKILYWLCELRMDRPDVEALTKDLPGANLRILPLGGDDKGATYWYFYGTRLYKEEPEPLKLKISLDTKNKGDSARSTSNSSKKSRSSKKRHGGGAKSKKKSRVRPATSVKADAPHSHESGTEESSRPGSEADISTLNVSYTDSEHNSFPGFSRVLSSQLSTSPVECPTEEDALRVMIRNIYSNEGEESAAPSSKTSRAPTPSESSNMETDELTPNETAPDGNEAYNSRPATDMDIPSQSSDKKDSAATDSSSEESKPNDLPMAKVKEELMAADEDDNSKKVDVTKTDSVEATVSAEGKEFLKTEAVEQRPSEEEVPMEHSGIEVKDEEKSKEVVSPPPWIQDGLIPPKDNRWSIVCLTMADWTALGEKYKESDSVKEQEFHEVLQDGFLPAIGDLFTQQEAEREKKYAEFAGRRTSDRLELKKLLREKETKDLLRREAEERHRQQKVELEKEVKRQKEEREARMREREKEQERRNLLKAREREERARRMEMRNKLKLRYEDRDFKPPFDLMSPDTLNASSASFYEREMQQLDLEIELDHMNGQLEKVLDSVKSSDDAWPFGDPVTSDIAPNYLDVIKTPMDLSTIENKLIGRVYNKKAEFIQDMNLMLTNCLEYNGLTNEYTRAAQRLERAFIKAWKKYFPPTDVHEVDDRARNEELQCISLLGELDRRIKQEQIKNRPPPSPHQQYLMDDDVRYIKESRPSNRPTNKIPISPSPSNTVYSYQIINSGSSPLNPTQSPIVGLSSVVNRQGVKTPQPLKPRILQGYGIMTPTNKSSSVGFSVSSSPGLRPIAPVTSAQTPGSNSRAAQVIPVNRPTSGNEESSQAAAKLIRTVGADGQPRLMITVPKGGCFISQENFEKLMASSKNLVAGQSGPIVITTGGGLTNVGGSPATKAISFTVKPGVSVMPSTSSPKQNISVGSMYQPQTSSGGGQTPTVIPLPDGKFIQRDRNGDLSLMLRNKGTGVLMNLGRLSAEVLDKANISKLLSGELNVQQFQQSYSDTDRNSHAVRNSQQSGTLDPATLLVSPPRETSQQSGSNVQFFSPRTLLPANKTVSPPKPIVVKAGGSIKLATPTKPICSVAPVLQQQTSLSVVQSPSQPSYSILTSSGNSGSNTTMVTSSAQQLGTSTVLIQSPPVLLLGGQNVGQVIRIGNQQYIIGGGGSQESHANTSTTAPVQVIQFVPQIVVNQQPVIIQTSSDDTFTADTGACVTVSSTSVESSTSSQPHNLQLTTNIGSNVVKDNQTN